MKSPQVSHHLGLEKWCFSKSCAASVGVGGVLGAAIVYIPLLFLVFD